MTFDDHPRPNAPVNWLDEWSGSATSHEPKQEADVADNWPKEEA